MVHIILIPGGIVLNFQKGRVIPFLTILYMAMSLIGCSSDDDNPADNHHHSDHLHAEGVRLIHGLDTLLTAQGTSVAGEIVVRPGDTLWPIVVWFFDPDSGWYHPEHEEHEGGEHDHELALESRDSTKIRVHTAEQLGDTTDLWRFQLIALHPGQDSLRVKILHVGHPDYVSPQLPVEVRQP